MTPSATFTLPTTQVVTVDAQVNFPDYEVNQVIGSGTTLRKLGAGGSVIKSYKVTSQNTSGHVYHVNESFTLEAGDYVPDKYIEFCSYQSRLFYPQCQFCYFDL
ncbi:hypothetical protein NIB75_03660 [Bacteroides uniformis]|nr:hypothetical protein [Bacteroides uniformis]